MKTFTKRGLLLVAALSILAFAAAPAHAGFTNNRRGGTGTITGTASDSSLVSGALTVSCGRSDASVTLSSASRGSGTITFVSGTGRTCVESVFGSSCTIRVDGTYTLTDTAASSSAARNASTRGTVVLDSNFRATVDCILRDISVSGPQDLGSCATFTVATQILNLNCNIADSTTGGARTSSFRGNYRVTSGAVTLS